MVAKEVMNRIVTAATRRTNGRDLAVKLLSGMYSGLPVVEEGRVIGVVTEFDLLLAIKKGKELHEITAEDIMTHDPICVDEATEIDEIISIMTEDNVIRVPVVKDGNLVGIISRSDVLRGLIQSKYSTLFGDQDV